MTINAEKSQSLDEKEQWLALAEQNRTPINPRLSSGQMARLAGETNQVVPKVKILICMSRTLHSLHTSINSKFCKLPYFLR